MLMFATVSLMTGGQKCFLKKIALEQRFENIVVRNQWVEEKTVQKEGGKATQQAHGGSCWRATGDQQWAWRFRLASCAQRKWRQFSTAIKEQICFSKRSLQKWGGRTGWVPPTAYKQVINFLKPWFSHLSPGTMTLMS